jgi:hypothetical protein
MGVSEQYSKEIRKNLSYFPSWEPGDQVAPGDVGELIQGVFHRQTTLTRLFPELTVTVKRDAKPNVVMFQSDNAVSVRLQGGASVPGAVNGSVELDFSRAGAVVFHAVNCTRRYIDNLHETREFIVQKRKQDRQAWPSGYVLVSHVEEAERFAVLVSGAAGRSVTLTGQLDLLRQLKLAEGQVAVVGSAGYHRISSGPILLRAYGFGWWGRLKPQGAGEVAPQGQEPDFQELSPRDPAHD